jgi:hypothetical protein
MTKYTIPDGPPLRAKREVVVLTIQPNPHEIEIHIADGVRISVHYGNTTREYSLVNGEPMGHSINDGDPPTVAPTMRFARLGPDELTGMYKQIDDTLGRSS